MEEKILWQGRKTRKVLIHYYIAGVVSIIFGVVLFLGFPLKIPFSFFVSIVLGVIGGVLFLISEIKRLLVKYMITETRVIKESGIINKKTEYIPYQMVERISFESPWYKRLLKIGDIKVDTGEDSFVIESVSHPEKVEELIRGAISRVTRYRGYGGRNV